MMTTSLRLALILACIAAGFTPAAASQDENVNARYTVERVSMAGVNESAVSQALRDEMQKMVGQKYNPDVAEDLAERLRKELHHHRIALKVKRGDKPEHVTVTFEARRIEEQHFVLALAPLLYSTTDQFSIAVLPTFESHHNVVTGGFISNADELLERNAGWLIRYEHRKVGTSKVQVGVEYDYFHPSFQAETQDALLFNPQVPGIYRTREHFAPSIAVLPVPEVKLTFGASFQTLEMQYPAPHDQGAYAWTFGAQLRKEVRPSRRVRHTIAADYTLRKAADSLDSDFIYTRQQVTGDYTAGIGRHHQFGFHFLGGHTSGTPPLFERFTLGNTRTLRGWDKFDVAPLGGTRVAHGSLEYRYRPFVLFYDVGAVWDEGQQAETRHAMGIGLAWKHGFFMSLGFPLRYDDVTPVFMIGIRR
jgi:hypothetical protein